MDETLRRQRALDARADAAMSITAWNAVWAMDIEPNQKLVLLAYADHARDDGTHIFPSIARIAEKTGLSRRWVQKLTRQLVEAGLLIRDGKGPRAQNRWRIPLPSGEVAAVQTSPQAAVEQSASLNTNAGPRGESAPLPSAAEAPAPLSGARTAVRTSPPGTGAPSSPVHSSAPGGEAQFTPGANPSSPEPSLTIKEPPTRTSMHESQSEHASVPVPDGAGPAYGNREKIPPEFLPYADIFHELTGLEPTQRVLHDWIAEFKTWRAEAITVEGVRRAYKEARYSVARPGSLTNMAAAYSARPRAGAKAARDPERVRRGNRILLWTIEHGRIRAAEGYKAMNMPFEDPATMRPSLEQLRNEIEGTQVEFRPVPVEERAAYLDRIATLLPPPKRGWWSRR